MKKYSSQPCIIRCHTSEFTAEHLNNFYIILTKKKGSKMLHNTLNPLNSFYRTLKLQNTLTDPPTS